MIRSAAFSAIITVGELVLPDVMVGMIEASAMRKSLEAAQPQPRVDDRHRVIAHAAGADRVEDRRADVACCARSSLVGRKRSAGAEFLPAGRAHRLGSRARCGGSAGSRRARPGDRSRSRDSSAGSRDARAGRRS